MIPIMKRHIAKKLKTTRECEAKRIPGFYQVQVRKGGPNLKEKIARL